MNRNLAPRTPNAPRLRPLPAACAALCLCGALGAQAAEGYKLRQSPVGLFGGEIAANADNPGFFGTAALSFTTIDRVVDGSGNDITVAARSVPLPTGTPTAGRVPNGTFSLNVPAGTIDFNQDQTQLNLAGGYTTEAHYGGGRWTFAVNIPLIKQSRTFVANQAAGTVSPSTAALPAPLQTAVATIAAAAQAQVTAGVAATVAPQNADVTGIGDTELSAVWISQQGRLKVAAGVSLYVPTGEYDKNRGPNPGFGNFYTLRPGIALSYSLNPNHTDTSWDSGVTIAGRFSYGINTVNKDTDYRSGNFVYFEGGIVKVSGNWAVGANLLAIRQVTDDSGSGATLGPSRYRNNAAGPFISYKLPGQEAGFNLHYSRNFDSANALMSHTWQLRFIKAW